MVIEVNDVKKALSVLERNLGIRRYKVVDEKIIRIYDEIDNRAAVNRELVINDISVSGLHESGVSLEEYFKGLIKEENND